MLRYSIETIAKVKELRKMGYSIHALMAEFSIPKTSIWHHIHKIKLSKKALAKIKSNQGGSRLKKERDWIKSRDEARILLNGEYRYLVSLLAMLYWAEGDNKNGFSFTNTNTDMVIMFINILEKCFRVSRRELMITIRYFTGMNRSKCLRHWSMVTKVSKTRITMYYNDGGKRGRTEFGICRIAVRKSGYLFKVIRSLIAEISKEINAPVA